jgi:hypothetical protein
VVFKSETPKSHVLGWKGPAKKVRRCVIVLPSCQKSHGKAIEIRTIFRFRFKSGKPYGIRSDFRGRTTMLGPFYWQSMGESNKALE